MEFWPTDFRANTAKKKWKNKETIKSDNYSLRPGSLGAAALTTRDTEAQPQWITLSNLAPKVTLKRISQPVEVFPATRGPLLSSSGVSVHQQAEHGARFLRTYCPDVDIPFEIIKEEFQSDKDMTAETLLDPYTGNSLTYFNRQSKRKQGSHFLAFPSGSTGSELNVSPFFITKGQAVTFNPSAESVIKFQTPILQLGAFNTDIISEKYYFKYFFLAVRTHAAIDVVKFQEAGSNPLVTADIVATIKTTETENARVVDMSCGLQSNLNTDLLLVNTAGVLYNCQIDCSRKSLFSLCDGPILEDSELDAFWRICRDGNNDCVRISGKKAHILDLRVCNGMPREIFNLLGSNEYITSLEVGSTLEHLVSFSTTNRLLWYDIRNFGRPILSLKHDRAFDRSLRMRSVSMGPHALVTLSSSRNNLITIYDIARLASGHLQLDGIPSMLSFSAPPDIPITESLLLPHFIHEGQGCSLFQFSSRGALWKTDFYLDDRQSNESKDSYLLVDFEWDNAVKNLAKDARGMTEYIGSLGEREYIEVNLHSIVETLLNGSANIEDPDVVYATLEKMPSFWQSSDAPVEHMLTTFDIAFRSGVEPRNTSRADFLLGSTLNTSQGVAALCNGRIPFPSLNAAPQWHRDLAVLPSYMIPDVTKSTHELVRESIADATTKANSPHGVRRVIVAAQNLAVDLALSRHVYVSNSFAKGTSGGHKRDYSDELAMATKEMSLSISEPSAVQFGFLRPLEKTHYKDEEKMHGKDDALNLPLGVRSLLSEWKTGINPSKYIYKDHYNDDVSSIPTVEENNRRNQRSLASQLPSIPPIITTSRPPLPLHSSTLPETFAEHSAEYTAMARGVSRFASFYRPGIGASQGDFLESQLSSQEFLGPSTQPVPGPFGGGNKNSAAARKNKLEKKRMSGF